MRVTVFALAALASPAASLMLGVRPVVTSRARAVVAESKESCDSCVRIDDNTVKNVAEAAYSDAACALPVDLAPHLGHP